ncbi:hypothetical protein [Persicirhabdus sediminis]|uniref:Uncharacterized protein n=1 Tax=Persicirhabdus sediminis TaxID=454144 RepID=A0A8J7SKT2_9BACT|nr:hypothetical protein [Persicirhabdus sediminis]MBK1790975.1 hypothetical protein [Persicirhabdus sediminis]
MADSLWMRLRNENWNQLECASGSASSIPKFLQNLASRKAARAMKASHDLWSALGVNHDSLCSANEVTFPYLLEILYISEVEIQCEILDLIIPICKHADSASWKTPASKELSNHHPLIKKLSFSKDEMLAEKSQQAFELID